MKALLSSRWLIIVVIVAVAYYLWRQQNAALKAAEQRADNATNQNVDPITAAKNSADALLAKANNLVSSIRKDPGIGSALGLAQQEIDRITLGADKFAAIYQRAPINDAGSTRPITDPTYFHG